MFILIQINCDDFKTELISSHDNRSQACGKLSQLVNYMN